MAWAIGGSMSGLINGIFDVLATLFDKVPVLSRLKGYRSVLGFVGLAAVSALRATNHGTPEVLNALEMGFVVFTGLALNSKGRE